MSRTVSVNGRRMKVETNSIGISSTCSAGGTFGTTMLLRM